MKKLIDFLLIKPRYIDGELIENQWFWLGAWINYEPDANEDPCPTWEIIYSKWRLMVGKYRGRIFWQALFKFWPHRIGTNWK